ncbi:MAG TPA: peptidoglycan-associated lipoprotein Pal [Gemmatimonadaceae bacterium]|jgi:peptidoglycan-associated lipoprotein
MLASKFVAPIAAILAVAACHHAPPAVTPTPESQSAAAPTAAPARSDVARRGGDGAVLAGEARDRELAAARAAVARPVYFDFDNATIRNDQRDALEAKVPALSRSSGLRIRVEGNTDERGSAEYNIALGMRRAAEARRFLTDRGIDASRIDVVSYGEERPACTGSDESCWQQNRRDDFKIAAGDVTVPTAKP